MFIIASRFIFFLVWGFAFLGKESFAQQNAAIVNDLTILDDPGYQDWPQEKIWSQQGLLYTSGDQLVARINRQAIVLINEQKLGQAQKLLEKGRDKAPQFLPFRFNLGMVYYRQKNYPLSYDEFVYCARLMPYWSHIYVMKGYSLEMMRQYNEAKDAFRQAIKMDKRNLEAIIALGNLMYHLKSYYQANQYYEHALKIQPGYADAMLGVGKVLFAYAQYYEAALIFGQVAYEKFDEKERSRYDKAFHYYYAESLYKIGRYSDAVRQYEILLSYPDSDFFLTHAKELMEFKLQMARRFAMIEQFRDRSQE